MEAIKSSFLKIELISIHGLLLSYLTISGTYPTFAAPYHPATNGTFKRANETLVSVIRKMCL